MVGSTLHTSSLFSVRRRTDAHPRAYGEPSYAFLDRAAGARWERVRTTLDAWFERLPAPARADLRSRFARDAELDHLGAFWELWVHEAHCRLGFEVAVNIGTERGERCQDFVVSCSGGRRWFVEATVVGGESPLSFTQRKLDEQLCDLIDTVRVPRFSLGLEVARYGCGTPARRRVVPPIERWLHELDPDELLAGQAAGAPAPAHRLEFEGWRIDLEAMAVPRSAAEPAAHRVLGARPALDADGEVNDIRPLRRKIKKKAARYGELDRPYLVAVLALGDFVGDDDVAEALLGLTPDRRERVDGVWIGPGGPHNTRLSGVLVARGLEPTRIARTLPTLWHNPWALRPLELALPWRSARLRGEDELGFAPPSVGAASLFELSPRWPGTDAADRAWRRGTLRGRRPVAAVAAEGPARVAAA